MIIQVLGMVNLNADNEPISEWVPTGIISKQAMSQEFADALVANNPHVRHGHLNYEIRSFVALAAPVVEPPPFDEYEDN